MLTGILAGLFLFSNVASAHLGDSEKQVSGTFGAETSSQTDSSGNRTATFERPGQLVIAKFTKGKCVSLVIISVGSEYTGAQVAKILNQNSQGKKWTHNKDGGDLWMRDDGATAYSTGSSVDIQAPTPLDVGIPSTAIPGGPSQPSPPSLPGTPEGLGMPPAPPTGSPSPSAAH